MGAERNVMSKTDKTRPYQIQVNDPYNKRFIYWKDPTREGHIWVWKRLYSCSKWCCSQKKAWLHENKQERTRLRSKELHGIKGQPQEWWNDVSPTVKIGR